MKKLVVLSLCAFSMAAFAGTKAKPVPADGATTDSAVKPEKHTKKVKKADKKGADKQAETK